MQKNTYEINIFKTYESNLYSALKYDFGMIPKIHMF